MTQTITVYGIPRIGFDAYPEYQVYPDATVYFDNESQAGYPNYYWTFGDGQTQVDTDKETGFPHEYDTWGTYTITLAVNSSNACNDTVRQSIVIAPPIPKDRGGRLILIVNLGLEPLKLMLILQVVITGISMMLT
jgi:PKD repeat protein